VCMCVCVCVETEGEERERDFLLKEIVLGKFVPWLMVSCSRHFPDSCQKTDLVGGLPY
jgi:hypothetical protein